jgi:hypothetical protein
VDGLSPLKPTKPFYKMMLEKHNVHPTKSQEKWQIRLEILA